MRMKKKLEKRYGKGRKIRVQEAKSKREVGKLHEEN